ncbi:MAG: hypothetical protein WBD24_04605 [Candidatus Omnitrophota bacterium]
MRRSVVSILLLVGIMMFTGAHPVFAYKIKEKRDTWGDVVEKQYYRDDGSLEQVIEYDSEGQKTSEAYYERKGKLKEGPDGWAAMEWKYKNGKIVGEGYYDANGHIKELKIYNEEGDLVNKKYYGDSGIDPAEEYDPVPPLAGESISYYDKYGHPEGTTSLEYEDWFPGIWPFDDDFE